jgi:hypothetical protein
MVASAAPARVTDSLHRLWVFDFDWTVVDENSDTWIHRCAPGGSLPPSVKNAYVAPDWVGYMNRVLGFLAQHGVTADDVRAQLEVRHEDMPYLLHSGCPFWLSGWLFPCGASPRVSVRPWWPEGSSQCLLVWGPGATVLPFTTTATRRAAALLPLGAG